MEKKKTDKKTTESCILFFGGGGSVHYKLSVRLLTLYCTFFCSSPNKKTNKKHLLKKFQTLTSCKCMMMSHTVKALTS